MHLDLGLTSLVDRITNTAQTNKVQSFAIICMFSAVFDHHLPKAL